MTCSPRFRPTTRSDGFVRDQFAIGGMIWVLTVVNALTRFSPAIKPPFSFRAADVVDVLEHVSASVAFEAIRADRGRSRIPGTRFVSLLADNAQVYAACHTGGQSLD